MKNIPKQIVSEKSYGSEEGKSIILLNAIFKNNYKMLNEILSNSTTAELDKILSSVNMQVDGKILLYSIDLIKVAVEYKCSDSIIEKLKIAIYEMRLRLQDKLFNETYSDRIDVDKFILELYGNSYDHENFPWDELES